MPYLTVSWEQDADNYDWKFLPAMQKATIDKKKIRDQLKIKRDLLLEEYSKNPLNIRFAFEIRLIDDQIAELEFQIRAVR